MSRHSTIPAVKRALVTVLRAAVDPEQTQVFRNPQAYEGPEAIAVGDAKGTRRVAQLGNPHQLQIEENYTITLHVEVRFNGNDPDGCEERLFALCDEIDQALIDFTLGGIPLLQFQLVEGFDQTSEGGNDGWRSNALMDVAVTARI